MATDPGDQLLTMLEHDWVSDTSMTHLSFLLRHALFLHQPAAEAAMSALRATETITESDFHGNPDIMALCTGSAYEGVFPPPLNVVDVSGGTSVIPQDADTSCIYLFRKWTIDDPPASQKEDVTQPEVAGGDSGLGMELKRSREEGQLSLAHHVPTGNPGSVRIKLKTISKELSKFAVKEGDHLLLSRHLLDKKASSVISDIRGADAASASLVGLSVTDEGSEAPACRRTAWTDTTSGPAVSGFLNTLTFGFATASWPAVAVEWCSRRRRHEWPEAADVSAAMSQVCHLVTTCPPTSDVTNNPDGDTDTDADTIWEMSFAAAERTLVCSLFVAQQKSYALLLTLYHKHMAGAGLLMPHHIKHVVFWTCEQSTTSIWREDNMAECLLLLLDRLLHFVCAGNLPDYFLPERNLLGHLSTEQIAQLSGLVGSIRRTPVTSLNTAYKGLVLGDGDATYEEVFKSVLTFLEKYPDDEHPLECIVQAAFTVGHVFLAREQKEHALVLFEEGCELMLQICQPDPYSLAVLQLTAWLYLYMGLIDKAIEYNEIICTLHKVENITDSFDFQTCLANLACLYHVKAINCQDDVIASHLVDKARSCFEIAYSEGQTLQVALHYAMFLLKLGQTEKAVTMLVDTAARNDDDDDRKLWSHVASFVEPEADILDDDLGNEVREAGELEVPTVVLTQYLISKGLAQLGLLKQEKDSNKALARLCRSDNNDKMAVSWALLGYCFKASGDLHSALRAFGSALKGNAYYVLAEENYNECKAKLGGDLSDSSSETDKH